MKATRMLIAIGAVVVLGAVNYSIASKETIKREGVTAYLELAPVDPRSLMQGDYMALRFAIASRIEERAGLSTLRDPANGGWTEGKIDSVKITFDDNRVAHLSSSAVASETFSLRYRIRNRRVWLGTNAFFFSEGDAARYATARYGEFKLDTKTGEAVLVGLRDRDFKAL